MGEVPMQPQPDFLQSYARFVMLELTSRCNLRCVYCALSQPEFHGRDLELDEMTILREILSIHPEEVQISGHGESTIIKGWERIASALVDERITVSLTTNLSRRFREEEIDAISRMRSVTVSCDTSDPELFAELRRGSRLERVEENLVQVQTAARSQGRVPPYLALNCTFVDRVVDGLPDLVRWGAARGIQCVSVTNLVVYPDSPSGPACRHPADVDPSRALERLEEARRTALDLGLDFNVMDGLREVLEEAQARWPRS